MSRRVLITGITGFAGSHLAERLVERGDDVHGLAHEPAPYPHLARVAVRVTLHEGDILDASAVRRVVERARPEVVFHIAGQAVPTIATADPLATIRINVLGTAHVADALRSTPETRLVVASSADVYGIPERVPTPEDAPLHPTNVYAATKVAAESVLRSLRGHRVTILRPCNQIGPRLHARLVASEFARRIAEAEAGRAEPVVRHGQLDPRREFLDVRDMAVAYEAAADLTDEDVAIYNVGSGTTASIGEILGILMRSARAPIRAELDPERVRPGVPAELLLDSTRFRERTGWRPRIGLELSLTDTLDFWRETVRSGPARPPGAQTEAPRRRGRAPGPSEGFARARRD